MKIRTMLIISGIVLLPCILAFMGGAFWFILPHSPQEHVNEVALITIMLTFCFTGTIILITTLRMLQYTSKIDKWEAAEEDVRIKNDQLNTLIKQYNKLILDAKPTQP